MADLWDSERGSGVRLVDGQDRDVLFLPIVVVRGQGVFTLRTQ
jgi:hypothetical protein